MPPFRYPSIAAVRRGLPAIALAGATFTVAGAGNAQCRIDVVGPESAMWLPAADELDVALAGQPSGSRCSAVVLEAAGGQAKLTFTASDGRVAERRIEDPVELVPTVQALSVEGPATTAPGSTAVSGRPNALLPADRPEAPTPEASARTYELRPVYGAQLGFRAGADHLISPCVGVFGAVPIDRWELGILGRYEAHYVSTLGGNEGAPETSSVVFGVTAGRREPVAGMQVRAGLSGLLAALHEDNGNKRGQAEARLGAYGGAVLPVHGRVGLRADLAFELVPYSIGRSQANASGVSSLPWWGVTSVVGVELN